MKFFAALLLAFALAIPALAGEGSPAFRDAFRAYGNVRRLEEQSRISEQRTDLEEGDRLAANRKLDSELTAARIDFQAFLRADEKELSPWEKAVLKNAGAPRLSANDKTALDFLSTAYAKAALQWSPAEWEYAADWFGIGVADSFLKTTFAMEEARSRPATAASIKTILWITDPAGLLTRKHEAAGAKIKRAAMMALLSKNGFRVREVEVHPFTRLDDQAEELQQELHREMAGQPALLVSGGHASAVLLHTFDLNPGMLGDSLIRGWVNVNGKLFGEAAAVRAPASITKADRQMAEARHELLPLRGERLERQVPLSPKFPVVNLISFGGDARPGPSVRDSLVPEGKTFYLDNTDAVDAIGAALPYLESHAPAANGSDF